MIKECMLAAAGLAGGFLIASYTKNESLYRMEVSLDKFTSYFHLFDQWMLLRKAQVSLSGLFLERGIHTIAIYGMGKMANHLVEELRDTDITVSYAIDRQKRVSEKQLEIYRIDESLPPVDAVVVTTVYDFEQIYRLLKKQGIDNIISLEDILFCWTKERV